MPTRRVAIRRRHPLPCIIFSSLLAFSLAWWQGQPGDRFVSPSIRSAYASRETATVPAVKRFVENFRLMKQAIPNYYASFTHGGDIIYFLGLNKLDLSVLENNSKLKESDMEQHLHLVRQIVWDCLISYDVDPVMYMLVDLRGLSLANFWTKKNRILTQLLRSIRDKTMTQRFHRVQVAAISENRVARTIVDMKRHKFPRGTDVQVYASFDAFLKENRNVTPDVLPRSHGGSGDVDLKVGGLEFLVSLFVEEILARNPSALSECQDAHIKK
ncbi:hypothetical protein CSUI_002444 [Cystoisospora suis]|uniref:CRAL-TRIO domain-containing protein n=1 Tax=Cystoisospora suis TaxID=483139 RepID=A0A2C6L9G2_9APIC|nr:hypothetical protein CSUI_002444 [Cystoisospora suis]